MAQKTNILFGKLGRQVSAQSFTTDDEDVFAGKKFSTDEYKHFDSFRSSRTPVTRGGDAQRKSRRRSKSVGCSLSKWKTIISLDTEEGLGDDPEQLTFGTGKLFKQSNQHAKNVQNFDSIDEKHEHSHLNELANSQAPSLIKNAIANCIFRDVRKNITCMSNVINTSNIQRKASYKLSRKLTRRMTTRQKQKLMMESEFDEFDDTDQKKEGASPSEDVELQLSDDSDNEEVDNKIVVQLNMKRLQSDNELDALYDETTDVELSKVQRIADELLATEKSYVCKLHLLDQIFQMNIILVNRDQALCPKEAIPQIFSNIKSIYQFHHDFLLPKLQQIIGQRILKVGEVMAWFAPFLKLYIEYVKNFDAAMNVLNYWMNKSSKFAHLIVELQKQPECGNLTLHNHMLEPVQRVPRYELLMKDYLRHLPPSSEDVPHTERALKIVKEAAQHSNEAMRKIEKFRKLLDVNEILGESVDLISPTRELVKEGKIMRVSARDGSLIERYIFLFNDLLLVCQCGALIHYKIKSKMNIDDMEIAESHNLETPNCFYARCQEKSIELHAGSYEGKADWEMTFKTVIDKYQAKLKSSRVRMTLMFPVKTDQLGERAPTWVKDNETSMCMRCAVAFSTFRRRHHCRACGLVICGMCSSHKAKLKFSNNNEERVCCFCYDILVKSPSGDNLKHEVSVDEASKVSERFKTAKTKLQVKGTAPSVCSGYMSISCDRKTWNRRWFAAHSNFILFSFKAHQDVVALTSLPLPGYIITIAEPCEAVQKENIFKVFHEGEKKVYYFQVEDINIFFKWIEVLQSLSKLIIPMIDTTNRHTPNPLSPSPPPQ